ncbi:MAG: neuraminidase-like domain-containing protein, partial [Pyrinomonadaceae bacterium]
RELFLDRRPDLFFKVFREKELIKSTEDSVLWNVAAGNTEVVIEVAISAASKPEEPFVVRGKVRDVDGNLLVGIVVQAFDKDLRSEELLGEATTNNAGEYEIRYSDQQFSRAEKGNADLVVKAFTADNALLVASPVLFNAPPSAEMDLTIPVENWQPLSLFEKIEGALVPLLGDLKVDALEEDTEHQDLSFLSGETGFEKGIFARFVIAHKLVQDGLPPEFWFALLARANSSFEFTENRSLKEQVATILDSLPSLDAIAVRKSLTRALDQKDIPEAFREKVADWIESSLKFVAGRLVSGETKPTFVKSALEDAGIHGPEKQEVFARLFNEHKRLTPELLAVLETDKTFAAAEISDLRTSFRLAELTNGDFSVVKMLKEEIDVRHPESVRSLAKKSESEWVNVVKEKYAAGDIQLPFETVETAGQIEFSPAEVYGKTLERQFREAFPTAAFTGGLERALQNGGAPGLGHAEGLKGFLEAHEDFELLNHSVDDYLKNKVNSDFRALAEDENFRLEVKAVQRVFKFAPNFEAAHGVLADGVHSGQMIYRMGESEFVRRYAGSPGFTEESARVAWNRAADTYGTVLTVVADLKALDADVLALKNNNEALSKFPNWNNLFKTGDLCECEHCRSVLSPAAYFADLLMFLKDRKTTTKNSADTVKDILFRRRPDLGYLGLNCANALTPLPYIDTVCEVLEDVVAAGENDRELKGLTTMPAALPSATLTRIKTFLILSNSSDAEVSLSQVDPMDPNRWVLHGNDVTYLVKKKSPPNPHFFAEILSNTESSAAELRAYPQYVNPKAYDKLRAAKYPHTLPFDLFAEEVRAAFQKSNLQRWDLMRTLRGPAAPNNPTDGDVAAEYFGISVGTAALRFNGVMTVAQRTTLLTNRVINRALKPPRAAASALPAYQQAIQELFQQPGRAAVTGLPAGFAFPTAITGVPNNIPISYEPFTFDEKHLILAADPTVTGQQTVWGETDANWLSTVGNVKNFLRKTSLEYNELLALLDLKFINPAGDIAVHHLDASCDTEKKVIQILDAPKLDRIHRFLRLWRKLKGWKMWELDLVIRQQGIGKGMIDEPFLINLFYFSLLRNRLGGKTTVEQVCALFGDLNTETRFTKLHEKREDALYQNLFLNKQLINPLDMAFRLLPLTGDLPAGGTITVHHPVMLAALGIREADLVLFKELTKASDGLRYITDDLTLNNVSFLWRHAWLSKLLKFKADEWKTILKIFHLDISAFTTPEAAWKFVERIDQLKAAGFTPDELNWLLAADRSAKAATKEADAARFLTTLRKELQAIRDEFAATQYAFLSPARDVENLTTLLTSILQKLNRDEAAVTVFLKTLRGSVLLEANVLLEGFTFPTAITDAAPNGIGIPIQYNAGVIRFTGLMTDAQRAILLDDASPALLELRGSGQLDAVVQGGLPGFTFPTVITAAPPIGIGIPIQNNAGVFRFTGLMMDAQRATLLNDPSLPTTVAGNPAYQSAIEELYQESLKVVNAYRSAIEELYQQSLKAVTDYFSMEKDVALPGTFAFPATITGTPNNIPIRYEQVLRFTGMMTADQRTKLLAVTNIQAYQEAIESLYKQPGTAAVTGLPAGFSFPPAITANNIPIRYEQVLRFTGVMTKAQKQTLLMDPLITVRAISAYEEAIEDFFNTPHLAVKFFELVFTAPLAQQPSAVDFKTQLPEQLAANISYDVEQRLLRFTGIMSNTEKVQILALSADANYFTAVKSLAAQPHQTIGSPDDRIWLTDDDLDIAKPENNTYAKRLSNAARKALKYLSATSAENAVVQQSSAQLGLTEALTRRLLAAYAVVPILPVPTKTTLMAHLTSNFTTDSTTFNPWFWANRVAAILKKWKITLAEVDKIITLAVGAKLLDFSTLPLDTTTGTIASLEKFLRTSRLLKMVDSLPEGDITLLEVLEKLNSGVYAATAAVSVKGLPVGFTKFPAAITTGLNPIPIDYNAGVFRFTGQMSISQRSTLLTDASLAAVKGLASYRHAIEELFRSNFAGDVERMSEAWLATDVVELVASLDIVYPKALASNQADYLLAESWECLRRAFYFLDNLNASASTAKKFAAPAMTDVHTKMLNELLRSKFGAETWLSLSADIQDVLRERKRDALAAYLLFTQPKKPAKTPTGKWENTNDLYAYYLLDVEMSPCQLTSRLVQASGSVQLFVQRCFMGLEPDVVVQADGANGDSAWRWWKWMRKYQVWVANRKVFLWPENWIEPELKKDRSPFFKDMENELLQNEINQYTVETAFSNYLEKLDGVAQLEIAGFFQEDDGDNAVVHAFGRTAGAEPHLYYYRRYDYRQWTPWEKVELDIQGDYLIPAVVNSRLYLFWPVFTEVPDETGNNTVRVPTPGQMIFTPDKTQKKLRLQIAVSDYRQGKWTPKRVSKDFDESRSYTIEIVRKNYQFFPIDRDGRFFIQYDSHSNDTAALDAALAAAQAVAQADLKTAQADVVTATNANRVANDAAKNAATGYKVIVDYIPQFQNLVVFMDNDSDPINHDARDKTDEAQNVVTIATAILALSSNFGDDEAFRKDAQDFEDAAIRTLFQCEVAVGDSHKSPVDYTPDERQKAAGYAKGRTREAKEVAEYVLNSAKSVKDAFADEARTTARDLRAAKIKETAAQNAKNALEAPKATNTFWLAAVADAKNASLTGAFDISGCTGAPEKADSIGIFKHAIRPEQASVGHDATFLRWVDLNDSSTNDFALETYFSAQYTSNSVVLGNTPGIFKMSPAWHLSHRDTVCLAAVASYNQVGTFLPFFYSDRKRTFFVLPSLLIENEGYSTYPKLETFLQGRTIYDQIAIRNNYLLSQKLHFKNFYHPFVCDFAELVHNPLKGVRALMSRKTQLKKLKNSEESEFSFYDSYGPTELVVGGGQQAHGSLPTEQVDFTADGAYSPYNWELFFHAPLMIANSLSKNQRFEEAREWYHFIFNPLGLESAAPS